MDGAVVLGVKVTVSVVFDVMVAALAAMFTAVRLLIANSNISVRDINRFIIFLSVLSFVFFYYNICFESCQSVVFVL